MALSRPKRKMEKTMKEMAGALALAMLVGCNDRAQADYEKCVTAEGTGDFSAATTLCETALAADPSSKSGKAAREKLTSLKSTLAQRAKADADAKAIAADRVAKLEAECTQWETTCKFADGVTPGGSQKFKTKAECVSLGRSTFLGQQLFHCDPCQCLRSAPAPFAQPSPEDGASPPSPSPDAKRPALSPDDIGFVDTRGGQGWGDKCWLNIKAKKWEWAKAECDEAMKMSPSSPQPKASLLFNLGLIAKGTGDLEEARRYFTESLALREHPAVRVALNDLPAK